MTPPRMELVDLGNQVRTLARQVQVQVQDYADRLAAVTDPAWRPADPELIALADRCAEWGMGGAGAGGPGGVGG